MVGLLALAGCTSEIVTASGDCAADGDCPSGSTCVADLTLNRSYCAVAGCSGDADCPSHQECRAGVEVAPGGTEVRTCIDRVRACLPNELCNGLDDDCDGVIDGPGCTPITGCLDDASCGVFVCQAPENYQTAICAPALSGGIADFETCNQDSDCKNGVCETGRCSPFCRFDRTTDICPPDSTWRCARAVGSPARPPHNACQKRCTTDAQCATSRGERCVWRDVYQGLAGAHELVCSKPAPNRTPLGMPCSMAGPAGDDECEHGLCYDQICTRSCTGTLGDCGDVGANFRCLRKDLAYGATNLVIELCARP